MENPSPKYLNCPWCPAQAYLKRKESLEGLRYIAVRYDCPGGHHFYIREEDPSFNFGHNKNMESGDDV